LVHFKGKDMSKYAKYLCWAFLAFTWLCSKPFAEAEAMIVADYIIGYVEDYDYERCDEEKGCFRHKKDSTVTIFDYKTKKKITYHLKWYALIRFHDDDIINNTPIKKRYRISDDARRDAWHNTKIQFTVYWGEYIMSAKRLEKK